MPGKVYILGVGPGDHKLLTLKAAQCIGKADVIVYDRLVDGKVLSYAREEAELIYVGKLPDHHAVPQEGINEILVKKALEGKTVARVKGGDPFVFGRGGEEAESLQAHGIGFEIVPGVTSSIAVPAYAGIPVTHRDFCSSFHVITGHERPDKEESMLDYAVLAKLEGTLVFLMGVKNLPEIAKNLVGNGKRPDTPAAVIEKGTTGRQRHVTGTLEDIAQKAAQARISSPAVTVVGRVVELQEKLTWFPKGALAGKRILVTRAREQAGKLAEKIEALGGTAIEFPTIRIAEPESFEHLDSVLSGLSAFQWLVFTSTNGVRGFFKGMKRNKIDVRALAGLRICAVGEATAAELEGYGVYVEDVPENYTAQDLLNEMLKWAAPGDKVLLARGDIADPALGEGLRAAGMDCEELTVYRTLRNAPGREKLLRLLEEGDIDYITFASSSTVKNLVSILGSENMRKLAEIKTACIGPVTAKTAEESGIMVSLMADTHTIDGLVDKIVESLRDSDR